MLSQTNFPTHNLIPDVPRPHLPNNRNRSGLYFIKYNPITAYHFTPREALCRIKSMTLCVSPLICQAKDSQREPLESWSTSSPNRPRHLKLNFPMIKVSALPN